MKRKAAAYIIQLVLVVSAMLFAISFTGCGDDKKTSPAEAKSDQIQKPIDYDKLQRLFISISKDMTMEDLESRINDDGLQYSVEEYNSDTTQFKIAFEKGVALQKHADSGDYVDVCFKTSTGQFEYADYSSQNAAATAIYYVFGTYWSFMEDEPGNDYEGYYLNKLAGGDDGGIVIKYKSGNETKTNYFRCKSAKDAVRKAVTYEY